jgi:uncharacterized protein (TIGR02145 family)
MAENLNYYGDYGSWCYDNNRNNCEKYGILYNWQMAKSACPSGWHLPSSNEYKTLLKNFGKKNSDRYNALKFEGDSGFNALMGGWAVNNLSFMDIDYSSRWWSSTQFGSSDAEVLIVSVSKRAAVTYFSYNNLFYVRCIQD